MSAIIIKKDRRLCEWDGSCNVCDLIGVVVSLGGDGQTNSDKRLVPRVPGRHHIKAMSKILHTAIPSNSLDLFRYVTNSLIWSHG